MSKEGSTIGGLMDTVGTLTSIALQYGVPLESLVKKFAYQRFEPSGFTKNPDIRNATSITDYVFRYLGCQFIKGYKEATSPNRAQSEFPLKEIAEMEKKAVNRPVAELPRTAERELIDVITNDSPGEGSPKIISSGYTHAERVKEALGNMGRSRQWSWARSAARSQTTPRARFSWRAAISSATFCWLTTARHLRALPKT